MANAPADIPNAILDELLGLRTTTSEAEARFARIILEATGIDLSKQDISEISMTVILGIVKEPPTTDSREALEDFDKAASKLIAALNRVQFEAAKGTPIGRLDLTVPKDMPIGRSNLAEKFLDDALAEDKEEGERIGYIWDPREYVTRVVSDVALLQTRVRKILHHATRIEHGTGRRIAGYDEFIFACHRVWKRHRKDKGYSTKQGRGVGPFVRFVYSAQALLPLAKRKDTEAAVGDAVVKALKSSTRN
ncbi:hypothetical protein [Microvirga sp. Mcv34]|uniref:hypothetical protein n=1 Tax=Microvirga sp. Mcv34 TaxID=2926016 RepID=UPI0021C70DE8|nr:hypothetical protein [Microvirga sp. Mcv34]